LYLYEVKSLTFAYTYKKYFTLWEAQQLAELNESIADIRTQSYDFFLKSSREQNAILQKVAGYKIELDQVMKDFEYWDTHLPNTGYLDSFYVYYRTRELSRLQQRRSLLERVIGKGLDILAVGDNPLLKFHFRNLEAEIEWMNNSAEASTAFQSVCVSDAKKNLRDEIKARQREHLKSLRRGVRILVRSLLSGIAIDRRAKFRSIVHFIFKNMDDYDGEKYALRLS
jgi:hypothetical protein